jgi:hypothetical protein
MTFDIFCAQLKLRHIAMTQWCDASKSKHWKMADNVTLPYQDASEKSDPQLFDVAQHHTPE